MDQVIGERENEKEIIDRIKNEYGIDILYGEQGAHIVFTSPGNGYVDVQDSGGVSGVEVAVRTAAMRGNPSAAGVKRFPCMADIDRVKTNLISTTVTQEEYCQGDFMKRLLPGVLAYQKQMQVSLCYAKVFAESPDRVLSDMADIVPIKDLLEHFGFHYIYDRPHYEFNAEMISEDMLERAKAGGTVCLGAPNVVLQVVSREDVLSLAHFVNSRLCRRYGFFMIRSAAYYEDIQTKLQNNGGNLFQIMEDGIRKGCFAYTNSSTDRIREVVFDRESDRERYFITEKRKKPAVMARIVNLPEMLKYITGDGKITVAIRIKDPVVSENDGLFIWYIDTDGSHMERVEQQDMGREKDSSMRPEITVTIGEFTALLFEYTQLKQNAKFDSIYLAGPAWMDEI